MFHQNLEKETKDIRHSLFGPLGKEACIYFYVLQVASFFLLVLACISVLHGLFTVKNYNMFGGIISVFNSFLVYFINRLLYSMCIN